jgi:hypothetical protein
MYTQTMKWVWVFLKKKPPYPAKQDKKEVFSNLCGHIGAANLMAAV